MTTLMTAPFRTILIDCRVLAIHTKPSAHKPRSRQGGGNRPFTVLRHWDGLILYLDDGRLEMDTNVVERAIRPVTITRKNSLFAGSDAGARRWAIANTLIQTCKLNGVDPLAWLTYVLQRIVSGQTKNQELNTLLPWNWRSPSTAVAA
jgi:transposase